MWRRLCQLFLLIVLVGGRLPETRANSLGGIPQKIFALSPSAKIFLVGDALKEDPAYWAMAELLLAEGIERWNLVAVGLSADLQDDLDRWMAKNIYPGEDFWKSSNLSGEMRQVFEKFLRSCRSLNALREQLGLPALRILALDLSQGNLSNEHWFVKREAFMADRLLQAIDLTKDSALILLPVAHLTKRPVEIARSRRASLGGLKAVKTFGALLNEIDGVSELLAHVWVQGSLLPGPLYPNWSRVYDVAAELSWEQSVVSTQSEWFLKLEKSVGIPRSTKLRLSKDFDILVSLPAISCRDWVRGLF